MIRLCVTKYPMPKASASASSSAPRASRTATAALRVASSMVQVARSPGAIERGYRTIRVRSGSLAQFAELA
jgi:hypothetical protein